MAFFDEMTDLKEQRAVNVGNLNFSKVLMQSPMISNIIGKLVKCRLDKGKKDCINNKEPRPKPVTRADPGGRYWD